MATAVRIEFDNGNVHDSAIRWLDKIIVFGEDVCSQTPTLTEASYPLSEPVFNVLAATELTISLPSVTVSPGGCFMTTW